MDPRTNRFSWFASLFIIALLLAGLAAPTAARASSASGEMPPQDVEASAVKYAKIVTGNDHTCGLTTGGGVKCWGENYNGQLGNGSEIASSLPVDAIGLTSGVIDLAAMASGTCALHEDSGVWCWGSNWDGGRYNGSPETSNVPVVQTGIPGQPVSIAAGDYHVCVVLADGGAACWGDNDDGQLGNGGTQSGSTPRLVQSLAGKVAAMDGGRDHTCALLQNGQVQCWGGNREGQVGDGTTQNRYTPVTVTGIGETAVQIATGYEESCAVTASGKVMCWGYINNFGEGVS